MSTTRDIGIKTGLAAKDKALFILKENNEKIKQGNLGNDEIKINSKDYLKHLIIKEDNKAVQTHSQLFINNILKNFKNYSDSHYYLFNFGKRPDEEKLLNKINNLTKDEILEIFGDDKYFELQDPNHPEKNFLYGKLLYNFIYLKLHELIQNFSENPEVLKYNINITNNQKIIDFHNNGSNNYSSSCYLNVRKEIKAIKEILEKELLKETEKTFGKIYDLLDLRDQSSQASIFKYNLKNLYYLRQKINNIITIPFTVKVEQFITQNLNPKYFKIENNDIQLEKPKDSWENYYKIQENSSHKFHIFEKKGKSRSILRSEALNSKEDALEFVNKLYNNRFLGERLEGEYICNNITTFVDVDKAAFIQSNNLKFFECGNYLSDKDYKDFINVSTNSFEIMARALNISSLDIIPKQKTLSKEETDNIKKELINELTALENKNQKLIDNLKNINFLTSKDLTIFLHQNIKYGLSHSIKESQTLTDYNKVLLKTFEKILAEENVLGLCAASRGVGGAAAHFETSNDAINITKKSIQKTVGVFSHEFGHFLDSFIGKSLNKEIQKNVENPVFKTHIKFAKDQYLTSIHLSPAQFNNKLYKSFYDFFDKTLRNPDKSETEFLKNNRFADEGKSTPYYNTKIELFARAFESMVYWKMKRLDVQDTFLVKIIEKDSVYLNNEEFQKLEPLFDNFILAYKEYFQLKNFTFDEKQQSYKNLMTEELLLKNNNINIKKENNIVKKEQQDLEQMSLF